MLFIFACKAVLMLGIYVGLTYNSNIVLAICLGELVFQQFIMDFVMCKSGITETILEKLSSDSKTSQKDDDNDN